MSAEVLLVHTEATPSTYPSRWQLLNALRRTSPRAYGLVRHYPWSDGSSPIALLDVVPASPHASLPAGAERRGVAYLAQWDHHGSQEELYVTLFILDALTRAVSGLAARLICRRAERSDVPTSMASLQASVEDVLLLELAGALEAGPHFEAFLADCGTNDFSYETDLVGRLWMLPSGHLGVVDLSTPQCLQGKPFALGEEDALMDRLRNLIMPCFRAPWSVALDNRFAQWLEDTALPAAVEARHTCVVAVPPLVAVTWHELGEQDRQAVLFHHTLQCPLAVAGVASVGANTTQPPTIDVAPARGRNSCWYHKLNRDDAVQERCLAKAESTAVSSLWTSFAVQAQNRRLVRLPLRRVSRYVFALLVCAPVPPTVIAGLAALTSASTPSRDSLTIEALQLGFQLTWALARSHHDWDEVASRHNGTALSSLSVRTHWLRARLAAATDKAHARVAQLALPPNGDNTTEGHHNETLDSLESELFAPDDPAMFHGASDAWVAESVAVVQREFLPRPSSPASQRAEGDAHVQRIARVLETQSVHGSTTFAHERSDGDLEDDETTTTTTTASTSDSDRDTNCDEDDYVTGVLREMEAVTDAVGGQRSSSGGRDAGTTEAAALFLDNKPLMEVMELLSTPHSKSSPPLPEFKWVVNFDLFKGLCTLLSLAAFHSLSMGTLEDEVDFGELRSVPCDSDPVTLVALNNDAVAWCTASRCLVAWSRYADDPQELLRLAFAPAAMTLTDGGLLVLTSSSGLVAYTLRATADGELQIDDHLTIRDDRRAVVSAQATCLTAAQDESAVALATPTHLALFATHLSSGPLSTSEPNRAVALSCRPWFGSQTDGCALVCFASPSRLLLCSSESHLVSLRVDIDTMSVARERDGHVLGSGQAQASCLSASFAHDNMLLVGFTNGSLQLLQLDTLVTTRTLHVGPMLRQLVSAGGAAHPVFNAERPWRTASLAPALPSRGGVEGDILFNLSGVLGVAVGGIQLTVLTTDGVLYVDKSSLELREVDSFLLDPEERLSGAASLAVTARNGCWCAWDGDTQSRSPSLKYFVSGSVAGAVQNLAQRDARGAVHDERQSGSDVIHAHAPLPAAWLATQSDIARSGESLARQTRRSTVSKAKSATSLAGRTEDRPVTFGHRIQSSGYSQAVPWSEQQKLKKKAQARRDKEKRTQQFGLGAPGGSTAPTAQRYADVRTYAEHPLRSLARSNALIESKAVLHEGTVLSATFTGAGSSLLSGSSDGSACQLLFPIGKKDVVTHGLRGHAGAVLSVDASLSLTNPLAVTSSADGTIALWKPGRRETTVVRCTPGSAAQPGDVKPEVRATRFFYLDKFICYIRERQCCLSRYNLETCEEKDGLMRVTTPAQIDAPLFSFTVPDAQSIAAMACINHFASPLVVLASSNKSLCVLDVAAQAPLRVVAEAHSRAIHHVAMCTASRFAGSLCGSLAEHTLLTAGLDGVVNLWDLRQANRACQFALHKNTALSTLGLALSPTGQQFAMGSEDRQVYIYDTRVPMAALDALPTRHIPSALAWHPTEPVLAVGDAAGHVFFYAQK